LNGNSQFFAQIGGGGAFPGTSGNIINSGALATLVANQNPGTTTFGGQIQGDINFVRLGGNTLTLEMAQTYTGATLLLAGTTSLENDATLLTTSSIDVNYATLSLNNNSSLQTSNNNRIGDAIPIALRTGTIIYNGRLTTAATETLGAMTLAQGANGLSSNIGGGSVNSADLTIASLTRAPGTTLNFTGTNLGQQGNNARIWFTAPLTPIGSGIIGAWAIHNSTDYAAYNTANGVGVVGNGGFTGYDATFGTGNLTEIPAILTTNTTLSGNTVTGLLKIAGNARNNVLFTNNGDILRLEYGGILRSNNVFDTSIGTLTERGVLTAGGTVPAGMQELVIFNQSVGNPTFTGGTINPLTNVVTVGSTVGLRVGMTLANANFPVGTVITSIDSINQVTLSQVSTNVAQATAQTFTGGSYVNGTTVLHSNVVTVNTTEGLATGMTLTGTGIPAGSYVVEIIDGTKVRLSQAATANGTALAFTVGVSNMIINSVIADNGLVNTVSLVKSGAGVLNLSANNTYTGGTVISQG
ncbi:MAG TPA: autotransporter-associated beta strand repeat-containing protein, partial [Glaciihabitans sp.]|nr:autotransporter-associated beta strand repeat-containing protein [Glaciihabitans sp.]